MGGCCGTSRGSRLHVTPIYYYCPQAEELESLTSHDVNSSSSASSLDTFHHPPMPIPFHADTGSPHSTAPVFAGTQMGGSSFNKATITNANRMELETKDQDGTALTPSSELELPHLIGANVSREEEENVCPTCFEDYTAENQKVITKCSHHFHLSCILEWMERSDTCPICNQEMDFDL